MDTIQEAAFESANTGALALGSADWALFFASVLVALAFLWLAWVILSSYRAWGAGSSNGDSVVVVGLRATAVVLVLLVFMA